MSRAPGDVDPFVGTGGAPPWFNGATTPAATLPFGMVQLGPDTSMDDADGTPAWTGSGYAITDHLVRGFSTTHLSGPGGIALGDATLLPVVGAVPDRLGAATTAILRETEQAGPGRYGVTLGNGVAVDLAASARAGLMSFTFPAGAPAYLLVKGVEEVRFTSDREVVVRAVGGGFCGADNEYAVHVVHRFDRLVLDRGVRPDGVWLGFGSEPLVRVQVAISYVDADGACRNLEHDDPGWSVDDLAERAAQVWAAELGRVEVGGGGDPTEGRIFRTALYHSLLHPTPISDVDGRYPGFDGEVHRLPAGDVQLSSISGWDVYRTQLPLLALLRPDVASQVVRSLHRDAEQGGWLPRWPLVAQDTGVMGGDSAAPMVAAAWAFGARDWPLEEVVDQLVRQGDRIDGPRTGLADYLRLGWVPSPRVRNGASITLEYAVDDFAISQLAAAAGRDSEAARYLTRSASWRCLLDPGRRLLQPRAADGRFPASSDGDAGWPGFEEGTAHQYTYAGVPHDMAGLLGALGAEADVLDRLEPFFSRLNVGLGVEPHAWLGNEPSFLAPWVHHWLGRPDRTQEVLDRARAELWSLDPDGLPGNDDLGALSAWYVWACLGLYPLTPGTPAVALTAPAFDRVVVRPLDGPPLTITRSGPGRRVAGVRVDGTPHGASWLELDPEHRPGELVVETTDGSSRWGTALADQPPSYPSEP